MARIRIVDVDPAPVPRRIARTGSGDLARGLVDDWVEVRATLARDGDARLLGMLRYRRAGRRRWELAPMHHLGEGRFSGAFLAEEPGRWEVQLDAWVNRWAAWRDEISAKVEGFGQPDYSEEIAAGCRLLAPFAHYPFVADTLERVADAADEQVIALVTLLGVDALPDQHDLVSLPQPLTVAVDPAAAGRGAWVELPAVGAAALGRVAALGAHTALLPGVAALRAGAPAGWASAAAGPTAAAVASLSAVADAHGLRLALRVEVALPGDPFAPTDEPPLGALLAEELLEWVGAGIATFDVVGAGRLPLDVWETAAAAVLAAAPWVVLSAAGALAPGLGRALCAAGFAQQSARLDEVPSRAVAEALVASGPAKGLVRVPRLLLAAEGGAPLLVAATLADCFSVEAAAGGAAPALAAGGALVLAQRLLELPRAYPAFAPGATVRFLDTGDERVLAYLRCSEFDEALVVASAVLDAPVTTTVTVPIGPDAAAAFPAVDLLAPGEPRCEWGAGERAVTLDPGGMLVLRLER